MARPLSIDDGELLGRLSDVFREVGYEGASLTLLSAATGLQKASLYHRFPGGKEQMAAEVMRRAETWLGEQILTPLRGDGPPAARIRGMLRRVEEFYAGGRQSCLLNMLSSPLGHTGPFAPLIREAFTAWIDALAAVLRDAGFDARTARFRAQRAIMLLQGSLVVSRGMGTTRPFRTFLSTLEGELLGR